MDEEKATEVLELSDAMAERCTNVIDWNDPEAIKFLLDGDNEILIALFNYLAKKHDTGRFALLFSMTKSYFEFYGTYYYLEKLMTAAAECLTKNNAEVACVSWNTYGLLNLETIGWIFIVKAIKKWGDEPEWGVAIDALLEMDEYPYTALDTVMAMYAQRRTYRPLVDKLLTYRSEIYDWNYNNGDWSTGHAKGYQTSLAIRHGLFDIVDDITNSVAKTETHDYLMGLVISTATEDNVEIRIKICDYIGSVTGGGRVGSEASHFGPAMAGPSRRPQYASGERGSIFDAAKISCIPRREHFIAAFTNRMIPLRVSIKLLEHGAVKIPLVAVRWFISLFANPSYTDHAVWALLPRLYTVYRKKSLDIRFLRADLQVSYYQQFELHELLALEYDFDNNGVSWPFESTMHTILPLGGNVAADTQPVETDDTLVRLACFWSLRVHPSLLGRLTKRVLVIARVVRHILFAIGKKNVSNSFMTRLIAEWV
jgi:hypothetical protein